jgi:GntR family transcriptional regulator
MPTNTRQAPGGAAPVLSPVTQLPRNLLITASPVPAYHRLARQLASLIENGAFQPEEQLPSEQRIADHLYVSRPTVRHALNELAAAKLIRREHGRGTFINHQSPMNSQ